MVQALFAMVLSQTEGGAATSPAATMTASTADAPKRTLGEQAKALLGPTFAETTMLGWLTLFGGIFLGLVAGRIAQAVLRSIAQRLKQRGWEIRGAIFRFAAGPANLALFTCGLAIGLQGLALPDDATIADFLKRAVGFLYIVAIGWFLFNLVDLVDLTLRRITVKSATRLDDTVVTLLRKALRIFLLIMLVLFIAQNVFNQNITAWLAGLGIAGLAVSLAAQDSIKNLFGSITVLISRPFGLGDRIVFGAYDGTVENINFRDTKIRTIGGHLVTVPNMKFTDSTVENISARPFIARTINLPLTYDTPPEKVAEALQAVRDILSEPEIAEPISAPERQPRVYFNDFATSGVNLQVSYAYVIKTAGRDWWTYQAHAEKLNFKLLGALAEVGIELAYPSQTLYLAGDARRQLAVRVQQDQPTEVG